MGAAVVAVDGIHAGEVDDAAPTLADHARQAGARQPISGIKVDRHDLAPRFLAHLEEGAVVANGDVVDENVDATEGVDALLGDAHAIFAAADIAHGHPRLDAKRTHLAGHLLRRRAILRPVDDNVATVPRESERAGTPDVAVGAGDQCSSLVLGHGFPRQCV